MGSDLQHNSKKVVSAEGLDRISYLPSELIDSILKLVPIRDTVKTCILSKTWKNKWKSVPRLRFYNSCSSEAEGEPTQYNLVNFVNNVLKHHKGIISSFYLEGYLDIGCSEIDQWMIFLSSTNTLQSLVLKFNKADSYQVPDCVFSCQTLQGLLLKGCILQLPSQFNGFSRLLILQLFNVSLTKEATEALISKCPFLKHLDMTNCDFSTTLNIHAPKLKRCNLALHVYFEYTPYLEDVKIGMFILGIPHPCKLNEVFGKIVNVRKLTIIYPYLPPPQQLRMTFRRLKFVEFLVDIEDLHQIVPVLCLCIGSPNLQELHIKSWHCENSLSYKQRLWEPLLKKKQSTFGRLKIMNFDKFEGGRYEFEFLKYVLLNAVALETLTIKWEEKEFENHEKLGMEEKIRLFQRASPIVQILFNSTHKTCKLQTSD